MVLPSSIIILGEFDVTCLVEIIRPARILQPVVVQQPCPCHFLSMIRGSAFLEVAQPINHHLDHVEVANQYIAVPRNICIHQVILEDNLVY